MTVRRSVRLFVAAAALAVSQLCALAGNGGVTTVSVSSPFARCRDGQPTVVRNAEVEPSLALDPRQRRHIVVLYQQDRYRDGAARGIATATSSDGGRTWSRSVIPVGLCATGSDRAPFRLSDPWVSIGPDGRVYALASAFVATSADGGRSWTKPVELASRSDRYFLDKGSLTADPARAGVAYAVWARFVQPAYGPPVESDAMLTKTTDGGRTWSVPKVILPRQRGAGSISSVILADPGRRRLYHLAFWQIGTAPSLRQPSRLVVQSSQDGGSSWSRPYTIAQVYTVGLRTREAGSGEQIRTGFAVPSFAVDRRNGTLYAAWQDARFAGKRHDQIVLAHSADAGQTWSTPVRVSGVAMQAFVPNVAVTGRGVVGVAYFETPTGRSPRPVSTKYRLAISRDGGQSFMRVTVGGAFDLAHAPLMRSVPQFAVPPGLFLGDYMGLAADEDAFHLAFVTTNPTARNPTDVRYGLVAAR